MSKLVVADIYNLSMRGGKFIESIDNAILDRKDHVVTEAYAEEMSREWASTGKMYVIDKEKTKVMRATLIENAKARQEAEEAGNVVTEALEEIVKNVSKPKKKKKKSEDSDNNN